MTASTASYTPEAHNVRRVSKVRLFSRSLGVTFFSIVSLGLAFYAFSVLPQVQDLLFDARPYLIQDIIYWAGFYVVGIFFWALPLVFTARLLLLQNFDVIGIDTEDRFKFYVFRLPSFFVVLAFAAVFIGVIAAAANLPSPSPDGNRVEATTLRPYVERHLILLFIATGLVLILVSIRSLFITGFGKIMENLEKKDPAIFKETLIRFERFARKPVADVDLDACDLHLTQLKPDFLSTETWISAQRVKVFMWRYMGRLTMVLLGLVVIHFLTYSDIVQRIFTIPAGSMGAGFSDALHLVTDTVYIKRAAFLFILFGGWLPFVTLLALASNRFQFPFITSLIVVITLLTLIITDGHDVRVLSIKQADRAALKPPSFAESVKKWKETNGWDQKGCNRTNLTPDEKAACPRPIIVSGEGGGSRAAFLIASVLGNLEDESLRQMRSNKSARPFHQQLFGISSVSGSSVGAAFFIGALQKQQTLTLEELKTALYRQRLWFLNVANTGTPNEKFLTDAVTYKDALQSALSNDFLSPAMIAYLSRDVLTLSRLPQVMDRAGVLETAWEDAFDGVYGSTRETSPLSAPLQSATDTGPGRWLPLLFMNSTSVETGRRVILTPVKMNEPLPNGRPLFIDAYDAHEFFCSSRKAEELSTIDQLASFLPRYFSPIAGTKRTCVDGKPKSVDMRLSTAAGMSSRSPFVSPHANLRDSSAQIADSVVDGGYFDNSGAVTALEIAAGIKAIDSNLEPYVIQVSSEPDWFKNKKECGATGTSDDKPQLPDESDFKPLGTLGNILTINATRIARGYETILQMPRQIATLNGGVRSDASIYICPQQKESFFWNQFVKATTREEPERQRKRAKSIREKSQAQTAIGWKSVSLSWWLSPSLQAYLDGQIYSTYNRGSRECVVSLLRDRNAGDRSSCG